MRLNLRTGTCVVFILVGLSACGGGSGSSLSLGWAKGVFPPSGDFAQHCPSPRKGNDPFTGQAYTDVPGTVLDENNFLRSWTNELYLWYSEVPDQNPANFSDPLAYFAALKTSAVTASGRPKDRFHFTYSTPVWESLEQNNVSAGYGLQWQIVQSSGTVPKVYVAYLEPGTGTPALNAGLVRGDQVLSVDGTAITGSLTQSEADTINAGLFPATVGETHSFQIQLNSGGATAVSMTSVTQQSSSAFNVKTFTTGAGTVGYLQSNDESATAEGALVSAINTLKADNITDLVVDMRYNGGGLLDIANEFAYMVAGPGPTTGKTFYRQVFNNKYGNTNPITGRSTVRTFITASESFAGSSPPLGTPLPTLNLSRVFVLTSSSTCSAAEAFINGLRGVGITVIQVGSTSCGKPYGFYPQENCGTTYFAIEFQGYNNADFGDYPDGFSPMNAVGAIGYPLPGCSVADDFTHNLGDPNEAMLAAALNYEAGSPCPAPTGTAFTRSVERGPPEPIPYTAPLIHRPWWRDVLVVH